MPCFVILSSDVSTFSQSILHMISRLLLIQLINLVWETSTRKCPGAKISIYVSHVDGMNPNSWAINRRVDTGTQPGLKPGHANMGCMCHRWHLSSLMIFFFLKTKLNILYNHFVFISCAFAMYPKKWMPILMLRSLPFWHILEL